MRTLVINALRAGGRRTAIGRHIEQLTHLWSAASCAFDRIVLMSPTELKLDGLNNRTPVETRVFGARWPRLLWEQAALPRMARGAAVLLCFYACPLFHAGRTVVSNHGIYEAVPRTFSWWQRLRATPLNRRSARRADAVIANSENTKADLVEYFGVAEEKIEVIYPGAAELFWRAQETESVANEVQRVFGAKVPYVIFVGKMVKRRHVPELIEAFARVRRECQLPHHLLLVGPNSIGLPLERLAAEFAVADVVRHVPFAEHTELAELYAGADVFVLPSVYEGLSRTMFEAMASGTAVLTVEHPVLREGGGDAVFSVPTPRVEDLSRGLRTLLTDEDVRRRFQERGRERARQFSMAECARKTMALLDRVALPNDRG